MIMYSRIPLICWYSGHPNTSAGEENSPKSGSFTIINVRYTYWYHDLILCYLDLLNLSQKIPRWVNKLLLVRECT